MAEEQKQSAPPAYGIIEDIEFKHVRKAIPRTTLYLSKDATQETVEPLTQLLVSQGLVVRPAMVEGKFALKISSPIPNEKTLMVALQGAGVIDEKFEATWQQRQKKKEQDEAPKSAFGKGIAKIAGTKEQRLQRAGIAYAIGDWLGMAIGAVNKNWGDFGFGFFAHLGTIPWIFYSRDKTGMTHAEKIIDDMREDFTRHRKAPYAEGIWAAPPKNAKEGFDKYMTKNSYFLGCVWNLLSGPPLALAGLQQGNPSKFASGVLVTAGWTIGAFVTPEGSKGTIDWGKFADSMGIGTEYRRLKHDAIAQGEPVPEKKHSPLTAPFRALGGHIHRHALRWAGMLPLIHNIHMVLFSTSKDIIWGEADMRDIARRYGSQNNYGRDPVPTGKAEMIREKFYSFLRAIGFKNAKVRDPYGEWTYRLEGYGKEKLPRPVNDPVNGRSTYSDSRFRPTVMEWDEFCKKDPSLVGKEMDWVHLRRSTLFKKGLLDDHIKNLELRKGEKSVTAHDIAMFKHDAYRYDEKRRLKGSAFITIAMIGSYMTANALISSVKSGADNKLNLDEVYSDAALLLLKQKDPVNQIALLADMTQYIADRPELQKQKISQKQVAEGIVKTAAAIASGPLLSGEEHTQAVQHMQSLSHAGPVQETTNDVAKKAWTAAQSAPASQWSQEASTPAAAGPAR